MQNELKPCPFCGKEPFTRVSIIKWDGYKATVELVVRCECGIEKRVCVELCDTDFTKIVIAINTAIEKWNRRVDNAE